MGVPIDPLVGFELALRLVVIGIVLQSPAFDCARSEGVVLLLGAERLDLRNVDFAYESVVPLNR